MTPIDTYARLKLIELALKRVLPAAADAAEKYREQIRARSVETDMGTVTSVRRKPVIILDPRAFLQWVTEHRPDELLTVVNPAFEKAYTANLRHHDGEVFDSDGVEVPFAHVHQSAPYLTVRMPEEIKNAAAAQVVAQIESWTLAEVEQ